MYVLYPVDANVPFSPFHTHQSLQFNWHAARGRDLKPARVSLEVIIFVLACTKIGPRSGEWRSRGPGNNIGARLLAVRLRQVSKGEGNHVAPFSFVNSNSFYKVVIPPLRTVTVSAFVCLSHNNDATPVVRSWLLHMHIHALYLQRL